MTDDDVRKDRGDAFAERENATAKMDCLRHRLRTYGRAFHELAENPFDAQSREIADKATDLREDWANLKRILERIDDLNRFLDRR